MPETPSTGYGGVHYDRTDASMPLIAADGPASHGLWAHADSSFKYDLGGNCGTLTGKCGLLQTGSGPVSATILLDGTPVW